MLRKKQDVTLTNAVETQLFDIAVWGDVNGFWNEVLNGLDDCSLELFKTWKKMIDYRTKSLVLTDEDERIRRFLGVS
jgi:hypothetical protein